MVLYRVRGEGFCLDNRCGTKTYSIERTGAAIDPGLGPFGRWAWPVMPLFFWPVGLGLVRPGFFFGWAFSARSAHVGRPIGPFFFFFSISCFFHNF